MHRIAGTPNSPKKKDICLCGASDFVNKWQDVSYVLPNMQNMLNILTCLAIATTPNTFAKKYDVFKKLERLRQACSAMNRAWGYQSIQHQIYIETNWLYYPIGIKCGMLYQLCCPCY